MAEAMREPTERGTLVIADKVVQRIASRAAVEAGAVASSSGWSRVMRRGLPRATTTIAGNRCRIAVDIAAPWSTPLAAATASVRDHVSERIHTLTGVDVTAVSVTVAEVVRPTTEPRSRVQ